MDRWAYSGKQRREAALGPLVDGVLASRSERYRNACLRHLRALQRAASPGKDPDAHLPAVIAAWAWVGGHDLPLAMRELGTLARERLVPMIEDAPEIERLPSGVERRAAERTPPRTAAAQAPCRAVLREVASRIFAEQGGTFLGVRFSVASLCVAPGPVPVFTELRKWITDGGWPAGVVVALMLLQERGIADQLEQWGVETGSAAGVATCSPLLLSLAAGEAEVRQTAHFLGDLYESLLTPFAASARLRRDCVESLQGRLVDWVRDALPVPEHAAGMRSLFEALLRTHDGVLRDPLLNLLASPELTGDDRGMRAFAASVRV
jgi:hypothetical protein